jgi:Holliday junction resolvase RusA-like endonuclease
MRDLLEHQFVIPGACPPKGSRVPVRKGSDKTRESSKRVEPWTEVAIRAMRDHLGKPLMSFSGPVYVVPTFVLKRPKVTEHEFPTAPNLGDLDKLVRCLLDAMTKAGVIEDDRFVVDLGDDTGGRPRKIWGDSDHTIARVGRVRTDVERTVEVFEQLGLQVEPWQRRALAANPYAIRPEEYCTTTSCNGGSPHYHFGDGSWVCVCMRNGCDGGCPAPSNVFRY